MQTLKNWTLDHENPDGITLSVEDRHLLHIIVLEDDIWRVWLQKNGETALDRTWLISPPAAPNGETGRPRASRDGFTCPPVTISETADGLTVSGSRLRLHIRRPLQLIWEALEHGAWQPLAADRPTGAYELGRRRDDIAHYMTHDDRDRYYGLGEKAGTVDRSGKKYQMRSLDAMGYNAETTDPLYKHWPYYQVRTAAGAHYGIFYDNLNTARFNMGCELDNYHPRYRSYRAEGGDLDYYLIHGASIAAVTKRFLHLTGKNTFPPKWSLGYSGSTMSYTDAPDAQQQLQQFIALCREHAIPCDSFQLSSGYTTIGNKRYVFHWNHDKIPDPKDLAQTFRDAGIRLAANIKPCLLHDHPRYREAAAQNLFIQDSEADRPETSMFWDAEGSHLDFTNPATGAWWRDNVKTQLLDIGICSTWNDNNEYEIWDGDARCHGFGTPIAIRHIRPLMSLLMMQNSWRAQREHNPHERPYLISRSGCPGLQRYVQTWSGDNRTSWHTLKWNIRMAIGMSLSGMYHIGHDIGGFAGPKSDAELFLRWIQSALLLPRFTIHSWNDDHSVNEPWMHPSITAAVRDAIRLRYRLIPHLYTLLWQAATQDEAIVRPTFLDHEHDARTYADTDDYLIGRDLLASPVTAPGVRARDTYLPDNTLGWYDYHRGTWHSGGQTLHIQTPLEQLQLYVRAGSIIAEGALMHADSPAADTERTLRLYPAKGNEKTEGIIYDDNGTATDGEHWQLHWRLHGHGDELYLRLDASGDYQPAYRDNLRVALPPNETRRLIISGNIAVCTD